MIANAIPVGCAFGMFLTAGDGAGCGPDLRTWLLVQAALCLINIVMGFYVCCRFSRPYDLDDPKDRDIVARTEHMLCYDPVMALYLLVGLFFLVWLCLGASWFNATSAACAGGTTLRLAEVALACGWLFLIVGGFVFFVAVSNKMFDEGKCDNVCCGCCKACWQCCCEPPHHHQQHQYQQQQQQQQQQVLLVRAQRQSPSLSLSFDRMRL